MVVSQRARGLQQNKDETKNEHRQSQKLLKREMLSCVLTLKLIYTFSNFCCGISHIGVSYNYMGWGEI